MVLVVLTAPRLHRNPTTSAVAVTLLILHVGLVVVAAALPDELLEPRWCDRRLFSLELLIVTFAVFVATIVPAGSNILGRRIDGTGMDAHHGMIQTRQPSNFCCRGEIPTQRIVHTLLWQMLAEISRRKHW